MSFGILTVPMSSSIGGWVQASAIRIFLIWSSSLAADFTK